MNYLQNLKTWCRNNLSAVGKWGGGSFLFGMVITSFVFGQNLPLRAYLLNPVSSSPPPTTELKLNYNPTSKTNIDFSKFFSSSRVSSNDITGFLKEAAITGINLTILVISITTQILKGLLSAFK